MNLTDQFINKLYNLNKTTFPEQTVHQAKRCLLDYLGVTFAGAKILEEKGGKLIADLDGNIGDITIIGFNRKSNIHNSVFINGLSAHVAELDDGVNSGIVHPGSPLLSALLPIAEKEKVSGEKLIAGIIIGYEATVRLADSIQPSHKILGYHATATCGAIGTAIGIAVMLDYSKVQMKNAFSCAVVSAFGSLKVLEDNSELKPYNIARASHTGLLSAYMANAGFQGPNDVLSGYAGFISMNADEFDLSKLHIDQYDSYGIDKVYVKPYAACRYCHPAIEAALKLSLTLKAKVNAIKQVQVLTYKLAVNKHDHTNINGVSSSKMSIPYSVAVALTTGKAGIDEFSSDYINNQIISSLTKKISVHSDDQLTALFPKKSAAIVEITTINNEFYSERVDHPKGEPENPLSDEEIMRKFISLSIYGNKSENDIHEIIQFVWNLPNDLHKLFRLL